MRPRWRGELEEKASMSISHSSSAARFTAARAGSFLRPNRAGAVEYELRVEVLADEPLIDASARDNAVIVGS